MIYCPSCGTANRDGSRFCNDCGADLSAVSGRRCPMCSAMNPVESTVCNECGARLAPQTEPLTGAEGPPPEAEGPRPEPVEGPRPEPVEGPRPEPVEGPPFPAEGPSAEQETEPPDWLQQLRVVSEVPAGERPATPEMEPAEPEPETGPAEPAEEIPDWLKQVRPPEETKPGLPPMAWEEETEMRGVAVTPYPSGEEEPDWLKRLRAVSMGKPALAEEPAMPPPSYRPTEVPPAREVPVSPQEKEAGPDWLDRLRQTMPEGAPPAEVAEAAPTVSEEAAVPLKEGVEELPDWLREMKPEPEAPPTPMEAEAPPLEEEVVELPDWLRETSPEPEAPPAPVEAEAPPTPEEVEIPPLEVEAEELPDWLQELRVGPEVPPTPAEVEVPPLEEEAEELSHWLQELRLGPEVPPTPAEVKAPPLAVEEEEEAEEPPGWLPELRPEPEVPPTPAEVEAPPLAVEEEEAEEPPGWLPELRPEPEAPPTPAEVEVEELPDWLPEMRPEPEAPPTPAEVEAEELPDWLQRLKEPKGPPTPVEAEVPPLAVEAELPEEIPEWLEELGPIPEPEEVPVLREAEEGEIQVVAPEELEEEIAEEMPPPAKVPDWLKELGLAPEGEVPVSAERIPPSEEAPEWLGEVGPPELAAEETAEAPQAVLGVEVPTDEVPDWLKELEAPVMAEKPAVEEEMPLPPPEVEEVSPPVVSEEAPEVEGLAQAEIPAWLQELRPREGVEGGVARVPGVIEVVETTGLLAGIQGVLPAELTVSGPHKAPPAPTAAVTVGPQEADLFKEIITQEPIPVTEVAAPRRARIWGGALRRFIYLLIALAVIIPLSGGGGWFGEAELPSGAATGFYDAIQNLPSNSVVLLAFDYDPSTAAEMDLLAEPVLWHLMDRKARLMAISFLPTGPTVAGDLLDRVAGEHGEYQYGQDYVNLGYLPGQAAAPNELASDLRTLVPQDYRQRKPLGELPAMQDVNGIEDVSLIIAFAAQQRTLQWWIEQVGSQYEVKTMAAVSAAVEPTARPYHNSGQLVGLISGLPSAIQYEAKITKEPSLATASVDAQSAAHLAIVALIVVGTLASLVSARRK